MTDPLFSPSYWIPVVFTFVLLVYRLITNKIRARWERDAVKQKAFVQQPIGRAAENIPSGGAVWVRLGSADIPIGETVMGPAKERLMPGDYFTSDHLGNITKWKPDENFTPRTEFKWEMGWKGGPLMMPETRSYRGVADIGGHDSTPVPEKLFDPVAEVDKMFGEWKDNKKRKLR